MCMTVFKRECPEGEIKVYKVMYPALGRLRSPIQHYEYFPGKNIAKSNRPVDLWYGMIEAGALHAYTSRAAAVRARMSWEVVVELTGKPEDYVAHGYNNDIAFTSLYLTQEEYDRALAKNTHLVANSR